MLLLRARCLLRHEFRKFSSFNLKVAYSYIQVTIKTTK